MKLTILQENLAKNISLASRFTSSRAQLPILGNILLKTDKTKLMIASTNLEISVSSFSGAKIEKEGEITIPARVLTELVANLPKENVILESEKEQLKISTSSFSSTILGMNTSDFPKIPAHISKEKSISLSQDVFTSNLSKVLFASSNDETRPVLTGVLFSFGADGLTLVSTDGFRLSLTTFKIKDLKFKSSFVVPRTILSEIGRISENEILFEYKEKEKQIIFGIEDTVFSSRLLEGTFPDYKKIIPKTSTLKIRADKEDLLRAVKLASIFARDNANIVKIGVRNEEIVVRAESSSAGNQETKVDAKITAEGPERPGGVEWEIAFNYKFLEDFIGSVSGEEIVMEFSEVDKPGVFLDPSSPDYLHLIMPVKIQG